MMTKVRGWRREVAVCTLIRWADAEAEKMVMVVDDATVPMMMQADAEAEATRMPWWRTRHQRVLLLLAPGDAFAGRMPQRRRRRRGRQTRMLEEGKGEDPCPRRRRVAVPAFG